MTHGVSNAVATFGTSGLTDQRISSLKRKGIMKVSILYDEDPNEAGQNAAIRDGKRLFQAAFHVDIIRLQG
jgi:DNA primase